MYYLFIYLRPREVSVFINETVYLCNVACLTMRIFSNVDQRLNYLFTYLFTTVFNSSAVAEDLDCTCRDSHRQTCTGARRES